jgi:hypothetical protein
VTSNPEYCKNFILLFEFKVASLGETARLIKQELIGKEGFRFDPEGIFYFRKKKSKK